MRAAPRLTPEELEECEQLLVDWPDLSERGMKERIDRWLRFAEIIDYDGPSP